MVKVMIVDDEKKVCQLINCLIDWNSLGLEVVGMAHSGASAISLAEKVFPDIVITDIRMANVDGIELITTLKKTNSNMRFMIISGYKHFDYAHEAMKLGVEHYLLKPIDKNELSSSLQKIINDIHLDKNISDQHESLETFIKVQETKQIDAFIENIFNGKHITTDKNIFENNLTRQYFSAMYLKIDALQPDTDSLFVVLRMIKEKLNEVLSFFEIQFYIKQMPFGLVILISSDNPDQSNALTIAKMLFNDSEEIAFKFDNTFVTLGVSDVKPNYENIADVLSQAVTAIKYRIKVGTKKIIQFSKFSYSSKTMKSFSSIGTTNKMDACFETFDKNVILKGLSFLYNEIFAEKNYSPALFFEGLEETLMLITNFYHKIEENEDFITSNISKFKFILNAYFTEKTLYYYFTQEIGNQFDYLMSKRSSQTSNNIKLALRFIQEHYQAPISLSDVADAVSLNPSYLSTVFKKELGKNYSDYLIECRIHAAKQLLQSTQLTISEISEQIGYSDPKYFSKLFKKSVGLKPSAFRKLYS